MRKVWRDNGPVFLVVLAAELVLLALWPLAARLDRSIDEARPLLLDVQDMAELQHDLVVEGGDPQPVQVPAGGEVDLGGVSFAPRAGTSVQVVTTGSGYCVTASAADRAAPAAVEDPDDPEGSVQTRCWDSEQDPATTAGLDPQDG